METNQIYQLLTEVTKIAYGENALAVQDASGLISLGNVVLSSNNNTEAYTNTLVQRIGRSIIRFRAYRNKFAGQILGDMEFGAILQKTNVTIGDSVEDVAYELVDGESVDHYTVRKPSVNQKLFVGRNPYVFYVTIPTVQLRESFLSEAAMGAFISAIYGKVRNQLELSAENLARLTIATVAGNTRPAQIINLVGDYNAASGKNITSAQAMFDNEFLRYAVKRMHAMSRRLTDMSTLYNDGTVPTFTPYEDQRFYVIGDFEDTLETVVQYSAFHKELVELGAFESLNYWQSPLSPTEIKVKDIVNTGGADIELNNVVAVVSDRDAWGIYQQNEYVSTTPENSKGLYRNTFYHSMRNYLWDQSENFIVFTLNDTPSAVLTK